MDHPSGQDTANDIAIVGMAAHLPGAASVAEYWRNLRDGVCSIRRLSEDELLAAGENPGLMRHRDYVPFSAPLEGFDTFDPEFFGLSPKDAAIMDPQHRRFLETAWEALENAGHTPEHAPGRVGVFAGCGMGSYFYFNLCSNPDLVDGTGMFLLRHTGNDKDFLTTRVSHAFDLHGPSVNLQTACSTSLVAVHYAVQALLNHECDMALAGGVTIELPQKRGYLYRKNEVLSPDGECHAFDHRAQGTVFGSGSGVVVLRRLEDAVADGDHIWAVVKGTAVNNDGAQKAGYLAPSVEGQVDAVAEAQAVAGVTADTIGYVECHGSGTYLGDPIEVAALTEAFRQTDAGVGHCRIGSVKTNIGHLDTAAGVAALIKAALALHHRQIPPTLGFEAPNPAIDFENSPFRVATRLTDWPRGDHPRRAGVNSLGVGGTNAHAVLEEAPERVPSGQSDWPFQILTVSARGKSALDDTAKRLAAHLRAHPEQPLADVAWTLAKGRRAFERRLVLVADSHDDAARILEGAEPRRLHAHTPLNRPEVAFLFPGGGAQYAGMARDLYETEPVFADWMDRGLDHLATLTDADIRALWLPAKGAEAEADATLLRPSLQLPLIMITEYALAQLWLSWGIQPVALAGHSMGENTAACVAGVMAFEDCIGLVHKRGVLFDSVERGGMLSVALSADALRDRLPEGLDLGAENAPDLSVASGPDDALAAFQAALEADGVDCRRIPIDIAAHSRMLEPILDDFRAHLRGIALHPPRLPVISNRTGKALTDAEATDPNYWVGHLRGMVRFADCVAALAGPDRVMLEVGPGKALSALARQHPQVNANAVLSSLRHPDERVADDRYMLEVLGRLAALGVPIDEAQIWGDARRNRVVLPTYAFQRQSFFIEPGAAQGHAVPHYLTRTDDIDAWAWKPVWRPRPAPVDWDVADGLAEAPAETWLMFMDEAGLAARAAARLRAAGHAVVEVHPGDGFVRLSETAYALAPEQGREGYDRLYADLMGRGLVPDRIGHFWLVTDGRSHRPGSSFFHRVQEHGFYALLFLAQALAEAAPGGMPQITVVTTGAARVKHETMPDPEKATIAGPARVIPREFPGVHVATLDIVLPERAGGLFAGRARASREATFDRLTDAVLEELMAEPGDRVAALRGTRRYEVAMKPATLPDAVPPLPEGGTCLITGGFGGIGLTLAQSFADRGANIVLVSRGRLPDRADWDTWLSRHAPQDRVSRRIRAVRDLEARGATVMLADADVCHRARMEAVRREAEARFGRITGVIHGAGVMADAPILAKSPATVEDVFTPKIHGTQVLGEVFPDGAVDWMVLFSSSSTVTAPAGQVDYVAANEYLNAFARSRIGGATRVLALNWGIWGKVGMAADAIAFRTGDLPRAPSEPVALPLLDTRSFDAEGNRVFHARYDSDDWVIDEHRTRAGDALMPGSAYVTLAAHALRAHGETGPFEIRELDFLRPLRVADGAARDVTLRLARDTEGYRMAVLADATMGGRTGRVATAEARLSLLPLTRPEPIDLDAIRARCGASLGAIGGRLAPAQGVLLDFGPRWNTLETRAIGKAEGIADLDLPPEAIGDGCLIHPALLDIATGWAMELIEGWQPTHLWAPVRYGRVRVHADLPPRVVSWVRNAAANRAETGSASFDVTLCAPDGTVVMEIAGFTIRRLESLDILRSAPQVTSAEFEPEQGEAQPLSAAEERLAHNLTQGIRPDEGVTAFARALASDQPQLVVSSLDLQALTDQAAAEAQAATGPVQSFERPQLDSDFVAPETEIEKTLAGFWQELLGVSEVGVEDSFFDLGGHSLVAVRLFAMIRKRFALDLPISVLFEAPTIRACAALIAQEVGEVEPGASTEAPKAPARRFTHIVPMHEGEGGPRRPFFLVAGMFGNVLNLRHLAHLLGTDRPFYGLQARGLYGGVAPHDTIEDAARDMIAEMRLVQPEGPYMIGGFSGGGITAYEIARQLEVAGETVAMVVMLDTPLPQRRALMWRDRLAMQWQNAREKGLAYPLHWARKRIAWEIEKRRAPAVTEAPQSFHNAEIEQAFYRATAVYRPQAWGGRVVLFRPPMQGKWQVFGGRQVAWDRSYILHDNDWGDYVADLTVIEVPGDHDSMVLEPNVRVLAAELRRAIEDAEGGADVLSFRGADVAAE